MRYLVHGFSSALVVCLGLFSCVSTSGTSAPMASTEKAKGKAKTVLPAPSNSQAKKNAAPPKIQEEFQNEFARQVIAAGPNSEGWALFSDSSMEHNGQRWIIRSHNPKKDSISFCFIKQGTTKCDTSTPASTTMTMPEFSKIEPALKAADSLEHILPVAFDATTYEYLHSHNSTPETIRVVFITSNKPFPAAYETLISAFNH